MRSTWRAWTRALSCGSAGSIPAPCKNAGHASTRTEGDAKLTAHAHHATSKSGSARRTDSKSSSPVKDVPSVSTFTGAKSPWASTTGRLAKRVGRRSRRSANADRSVAASSEVSRAQCREDDKVGSVREAPYGGCGARDRSIEQALDRVALRIVD